MTLIDRYLGAIGWQLPAEGRDDILAELRDTLLSTVEEKEAALGRRLTDGETEDVLHAFGHPMRVAARYRTRQHLIGPEVLPLFEFAARIAAVVVLVLAGVHLLIALLGGEETGRAITQAMSRIWHDGIYVLGVLTFVAIVIERSGAKLWTGNAWKVRELPVLHAGFKPKNLFEGVFEISFGVLAILWWTSVVPFPNDWLQGRWGGDVRIAPASIWAELYWPILTLLVLGLAQNLIDLFARNSPRVRGAGMIVTAVAGAWVASLLLQADVWAVVVGEPSGNMAEALNLSLRITWGVCLAVSVLQAIRGLWMIVRGRA